MTKFRNAQRFVKINPSKKEVKENVVNSATPAWQKSLIIGGAMLLIYFYTLKDFTYTDNFGWDVVNILTMLFSLALFREAVLVFVSKGCKTGFLTFVNRITFCGVTFYLYWNNYKVLLLWVTLGAVVLGLKLIIYYFVTIINSLVVIKKKNEEGEVKIKREVSF